MQIGESLTEDYFAPLYRARQQNLLRPLDYQFARFICEQDRAADQHLAVLAAFTSYQLGRGDVCLPLDRIASLVDEWPKGLRREFRLLFNALESDCLRPQPVAANELPVSDDAPVTLDMFAEPVVQPAAVSLTRPVSLSERYGSIGEPGAEAPLIFDGERLYLQRYFSFEAYLNQQIARLAQPLDVDEPSLKQGLAQLFTPDVSQPVDWQQVAVAVALRRRFSIISGGPGTGKTTTVTRLLALYVQQQCLQNGADFVPAIKLAAPTGKAAARLSESIAQARDQLNISRDVIDRIPVEATTIHRLLGTIPNSKRFRHNADNPLHLELLVVDEASMIDLPMMARLLAALPPHGRIILIGDKHQLASVEAGSVLGDICAWHLQDKQGLSPVTSELRYSADQAGYLSRVCGLDAGSVTGGTREVADSLALLRHSYRFDAASGIGQLAAAINGGDAIQIEPVLKKGYGDIDFIPLSSDSYPQLIGATAEGYSEYLRALRAGAAPSDVLKIFAQVQLLAVLRQGVYGVEGLNQALEQRLNRMGLIQTSQQWYAGRPVMIVQNDHQLGLYNGDIGIVQPDQDGRIRVWFEDPHHPDGVRGVLPSRLPGHETVFAMTVHKSQGSEFARVLMILPPEDGPLMTRELVYTGVTRAKQRLELYARLSSLKGATARRTERASGLGVRLWT